MQDRKQEAHNDNGSGQYGQVQNQSQLVNQTEQSFDTDMEAQDSSRAGKPLGERVTIDEAFERVGGFGKF